MGSRSSRIIGRDKGYANRGKIHHHYYDDGYGYDDPYYSRDPYYRDPLDVYPPYDRRPSYDRYDYDLYDHYDRYDRYELDDEYARRRPLPYNRGRQLRCECTYI